MLIKKILESSSLLEKVAEEAIRLRTFMPRMIDLEVSRVCNLRCPGCLRNVESSLCHREEKFCTLDRLKGIMEEIPSIKGFNFMGDGEPLCNPEFLDIIKYIGSKNIDTLLTTNGLLLDKEKIEWLVKNRVYRIHVSVDGSTKEIYETIRAGGDFGKVVENLKLLVSSGINVCINTMMYENTIEEMPKMIKMAFELGVREITFLMPICSIKTDSGDFPARPIVSPKNYAIFAETERLCNLLGVKWIFPIKLEPMFRRLSFPWVRPEVSLEGDVYSCCYMIGRGKTWFDDHLVDIPSQDYVLGNIFKDGFRNIWYGDVMNELRTTIKRTERKRGLVITREQLREMRECPTEKGRFKYCEACLPRWGMACS